MWRKKCWMWICAHMNIKNWTRCSSGYTYPWDITKASAKLINKSKYIARIWMKYHYTIQCSILENLIQKQLHTLSTTNINSWCCHKSSKPVFYVHQRILYLAEMPLANLRRSRWEFYLCYLFALSLSLQQKRGAAVLMGEYAEREQAPLWSAQKVFLSRHLKSSCQ